MQQNIFGSTDKQQPQEKGLIISAQQQPLNKKQKDFNRLVKKLEKLRTEINRTAGILDDCLMYYTTHIHPFEVRLVSLRTTGVKIFFSFYTDKNLLSKDDRKILEAIMASALTEILSISAEEPDDEIKRIFKVINGQSFEEMKKMDFDEMREEVESMFEEMGLDIDFSDIDENMSEEDMARKVKEIQDNVSRQQEEMQEKNAGCKKTKKQIEKEERDKLTEAIKAKNISTIYKHLAKIFHPDLESDDVVRLQKEELMKQLTVAYENNDLHTLLKLEMAWLQKEEHDIDKLSNEKIAIYNQMLKEQVMEAEMELDMLVQHPRYRHLHRFASDPLELNRRMLENEKANLEEKVYSLEEGESDLKGEDALRHVKDIIRMYRNQMSTMIEWDNLLAEFLNTDKRGKSANKRNKR